MKRQFILFLTCLLCLTLTISSINTGVSTGAPPSSTGAPDEYTCATAGCHDTYALNIGTADVEFSIENGATDFTPGETYPLKVRISDADVLRFGFELVALTSENQNAGTFEITDWDRTQVLFNDLQLTDRQYLTYTFYGTEAIETGFSEWTVNWIAPEETAPVTFYLAAVSANDDATDKHDYVFTQEIVLPPAGLNSDNEIGENALQIEAFPNPVQDVVQLNFSLKRNSKVSVDLVSLNGENLTQFFKGKLMEGNHTLRFDMPDGLAEGIYLIVLNDGNKTHTRKISIAK